MSLAILLSCLVFLQSTESCKTHCQGVNKDRVQVTGRTQDCEVPCVENSCCFQACASGLEGNIGFLCRNKEWRKSTDTCRTLNVLTIFEDASKIIPNIFAAVPSKIGKHATITDVLMQRCPKDLSCILKGIQKSPQIPGNIEVIVELLHNISRVLSEDVDEVKIQSYSIIANHILDSRSIPHWTFVPERSSSSILLQSMISFVKNFLLHEHSLDISEEFIHILGINISKDSGQESLSFSMKVNDTENEITGLVLLPQEELQKLPLPSQAISIAFPTLGAILEASFFENVTVNGLILSVILPKELQRISLVFEKITKFRDGRTQCVGWHPTENKWDEEACEMALDGMDQTLCSCQSNKRFTSFSILMSPHVPESPVLLYIMYIGLGISIGSLILCLIIEAMVWRQVTKTEISYLRHICIVNIAATLLMADMGFIVSSLFSNLVQHHNGCVVVTFFIHFFYLSVFFWMFVMALLILYGIVIVFHTIPKSVVMTSAFSIGYGCPLIIAVITVAATEPSQGYVRPMTCWLNWDNTKALLAFVVPALAIVVMNLITIGMVIVKTQRPSIGSPIAQEMATIVRISKNVAILTPLLGLTWGFGIAIVIEKNSLAFHIIFSLLNAFQGFFILVFGTFLDQKIRDALKVRMSSVKWLSRLSEHFSSESAHHPTKGSH
ncbi:adhesion G-protein coupled receptor F2 [Phascolarctos cinereus]|uniref:Adhesion G-protein coupled receptor F2 n=1 Tax=Phascolarctos cinereus TaxID=38626 RepID=A0A6P5L1K4_PHACI|nr:adhesion G-protein coupled receptor F2 [Phascolarctos cinereus]XP_020849499.1 adhesion G-protein coupled receptor F2 [Phascolarctos cinereus]XP_020849500.1 adhesion G-protein coupled receptor F2 [Phascolarctos cinereus]XP_020849501.1 adhesion G-protein coupled receptor F2 [Phascolarctos cinereus]XP_020849502.1 adhesion G-protein coupled receptor F2 [Phascolarctos cinereus]